MFTASFDVNSNANPSSSSLDPEDIITDVKKKIKMTNEIMPTENDVEDVEKCNSILEIDPVEKSDNAVLKRLLRRRRYFDSPDNSWENCYNCNEPGHTVSNCTSANHKKPCYICGSLEHNVKRCKQRKKCFICKIGGHRAKNGPGKTVEGFQKVKICLKCGDSGHEMFTCKTVYYSMDDLKEVQCYVCKCFGHLCCVDYGEGPSGVSCYRCGQLGHSGLECASSESRAHEKTTNMATPISCYKCGEEGHKPRKCKSSAKKRRRKNSKQSNLKDNTDHVGVRSAPPELGEAPNMNKTQPKRRGGWIDEDRGRCFNGTHWGSNRSNDGFHENHDASDFAWDIT